MYLANKSRKKNRLGETIQQRWVGPFVIKEINHMTHRVMLVSLAGKDVKGNHYLGDLKAYHGESNPTHNSSKVLDVR